VQQPALRRNFRVFGTAIDDIHEKIMRKGDFIRQLKNEGVDKAALAPHVQELLALKAQLLQPDDIKPKIEKTKVVETSQQKKRSPPATQKSEETLSESELRANRLAKIDAMKKSGAEPFAYTFATTHGSKELFDLYDGKLDGGEEDELASVAVAGRIMTRRVFGKLAFFTVQDEKGTIQVQFDQSRLGESFAVSCCVWARKLFVAKVKYDDESFYSLLKSPFIVCSN
jgi:hypothetical protein